MCAFAIVSLNQKRHRMRYLVGGEAQVFSCMQEKHEIGDFSSILGILIPERS
jgi:hypothetical protein